MPAVIRLDRLLSTRGYASRSTADRFLQKHDVRVGERRIYRGDTKVDPATVTIDGQPPDPERLVVLLNKPLGHTCSHKEAGPLVYDLLPPRWLERTPAITSVGRLDKDTSGLLLLSNDGQLVHRLTSPKHHLPRVYRVTLQHALRGDEVAAFASGTLQLERDDTPLSPARLDVLGDRDAILTIDEGRYHQVRRMFAAVGNHVVALHRERFGPLNLGTLAPGAWRPLEDAEVAALLAKP
jgi:16S rRNA pseudouridine516 synthase